MALAPHTVNVSIDIEDLRAKIRQVLAEVLPCSQCGGRISDSACGPTHALLQADPAQHRLLHPED